MGTNDIKYFAYVRKSSESKKRQMLSIPRQKDDIRERFSDLDIEFIEEERSAFKYQNRPEFTSMLKRIERGERTGLIAWHPNRLSRNEKDAGEITYGVRHGTIEDLRFCAYTFDNSPEGIMMLQFALSQSQYESASKSPFVKSGLAKKARMGHPPYQPIIGYQSKAGRETGDKEWEPDPVRFSLVQEMWEMMLSGRNAPPQILKIATDEWRLRTPRHKSIGGKAMARSAIYRMFTDPTYTGRFEYPKGSGKWHKGAYPPIITWDEFERVQLILGRKGKPRPKKHTFAYRGPILCGECGCGVTAEQKIHIVCSACKRKFSGISKTECPGCNTDVSEMKSPTIRKYILYHCTKNKEPCSQGSINQQDLEEQISSVLQTIEIPPEFKEWVLGYLKRQNHEEFKNQGLVAKNQQRDHTTCVKRLDGLIDMRANGELTSQEFTNRKTALAREKARLEALLDGGNGRTDSWVEIAENVLSFAERARSEFENGDLETKRSIFASLGSNLSLIDNRVSIQADHLLFPLGPVARTAKTVHESLRTKKEPSTTREMGLLYDQRPSMLRARETVRTMITSLYPSFKLIEFT